MSQMIAELSAQHTNFARLLSVLRDELEALRRDSTPDYSLMRDVMLYMTSYPDRFHHPNEELMFQRVREADPTLEATIQELSLEHGQILGKGRQLLQYLEFVANEHVVPRDVIESLGWDYVAAMYRHMNFEERGVFRVAEKKLTPAEWESIDAAVKKVQDPIFGAAVGDDFAHLYDVVMQRSGWKKAS